jgi:hypothetical protein
MTANHLSCAQTARQHVARIPSTQRTEDHAVSTGKQIAIPKTQSLMQLFRLADNGSYIEPPETKFSAKFDFWNLSGGTPRLRPLHPNQIS